MEILIVLFISLVEGLEGYEAWFRPRLRTILPDHDAIAENPAAYFAENGPVTVGPAKRRVIPALCGGCAVLFAVISALAFKEELDPNGAWLKGPEWQVCVGMWCFVSFVAVYWIAARLLRGGYTVLTADGVGFAYRKRVVFCPWSAFPPQTVGRRVDTGAIDLYLAHDAPQRVRVSVGGEEVETPKFDAKPFRIKVGTASDGEPVWLGRLYDYHRCRAEELAWLIMAVSLKLNGHVPAGTVAE